MIRLFDWIPAGVYPGENRGRNDEIHKLALMLLTGEGGGEIIYFLCKMTTDMDMEEVDCPLCKESKNIPLHQEGSFQMVRCSSCQFIYLNPRPTSESLTHFYQHYLPEDSSSIQSWGRMMEPVFHRAADLLRQHRRNGRLLDVGTGFGFFMDEMKKNGWEVTGVEISQKAIDYARNSLGLTIHLGPLEKANFPNQHFDVVTAFYVIEHLPDPMIFLKECLPYSQTRRGSVVEVSSYHAYQELSQYFWHFE